jgi:hypothetical protein
MAECLIVISAYCGFFVERALQDARQAMTATKNYRRAPAR